VYIFPDSVLRHNDFNIGLFKYPHTKRILEINSQSLAVRLINDTELKRLKESKELNLKVISQYYIRDNRLFELYFLLKVLLLFKLKSIEVNRVALHSESGLLRQLNTINNRNWRNAFISLSSFGFIDSKNYPTQSGTILADMPFCEFALVMFESYLRPYYEAIFKVLPENVRATNKELASAIRKQFNCRTDILFLTQSNGRYVSS
ncbi:MAG TPA: hypothetical protein IAA33_04085, partial [Candidatus Helicobacter avicola]|nr:hypothetical protein [Candidatus Helicobacter avicola]